MKNTKKAYEKHDIMFWLGLPYAILGGVFVVIGLVAGVQLGEWLFTVCFSGIGLIFLCWEWYFCPEKEKTADGQKTV